VGGFKKFLAVCFMAGAAVWGGRALFDDDEESLSDGKSFSVSEVALKQDQSFMDLHSDGDDDSVCHCVDPETLDIEHCIHSEVSCNEAAISYCEAQFQGRSCDG